MRTIHSVATGASSTNARTTTLASTTASEAVAVVTILADQRYDVERSRGKRADLLPEVEDALPPVAVLLPTLGLPLEERQHFGVYGASRLLRPALDLLVELGWHIPDVERGHGTHASTSQASVLRMIGS